GDAKPFGGTVMSLQLTVQPRREWECLPLRLLESGLQPGQQQQSGHRGFEFGADVADFGEYLGQAAAAGVARLDFGERAQLGQPRARFVGQTAGELALARKSVV